MGKTRNVQVPVEIEDYDVLKAISRIKHTTIAEMVRRWIINEMTDDPDFELASNPHVLVEEVMVRGVQGGMVKMKALGANQDDLPAFGRCEECVAHMMKEDGITEAEANTIIDMILAHRRNKPYHHLLEELKIKTVEFC